MIKTLIIEDEHYIRKGLIAQIKMLDVDLDIIGECESVSEAVVVAKACKPDLIFLDINLVGGTGFDFLEQTKELDFKVIFTTAYEEYALKALKNGAVDYILKPVEIDELEGAINKVLTTEKSKERLEVSIEHLNGNKDRLVLSLQDSFQVVEFKDLMYCQSDKGYTTFYLQNNRKFMVSKPIKEFENQLPSSLFFRTHQSYIVNLDFVDNFDKTNYISLKNKTKIPVSVRKKNEFVEKMIR